MLREVQESCGRALLVLVTAIRGCFCCFIQLIDLFSRQLRIEILWLKAFTKDRKEAPFTLTEDIGFLTHKCAILFLLSSEKHIFEQELWSDLAVADFIMMNGWQSL